MDTARRCILSLLSCFPQPIKTFGGSFYSPQLGTKDLLTDHGSTVYDIIFAGGYFKNVLYQSCNCTDNLNHVRRAAACVTAGRLAEADPSLRILVMFQMKFWSSVFFWFQITGRGSWSTQLVMIQLSYSQALSSPPPYSHRNITCHEANLVPLCVGRSPIVTSGRALGGGSSVNCMKTILLINAQTDLGNQAVFYARAQPRIMTIGKMYMGIKDGVLSIWYHFSKRWELYTLPLWLWRITMEIFYRQKHINQLQRTLLMAIGTDQSVVGRETLEHLQKFLICCWEIW